VSASDLLHFLIDTTRVAARGGRLFYGVMTVLVSLIVAGGFAYSQQVVHGLSVTGMDDHVSWGLYISNFTFLVGVAAAAVMVVLPVYIMHDMDLRNAVLIGEGIAVGALVMCMCFVTVDIASPQRFWHLMPGIGRLNWPISLLSWDIIVLNGYLALNTLIPFYLLFSRYMDRKPHPAYKFFAILSVFWAVSIHLTTAFLYASQPARPFWHTALLGPRFLASAFAAGTALIMLVLWLIKGTTPYKVLDETFRKLALVVTVASQVNLIMLASELFVEFYHPTGHTASAQYLWFGLHGHAPLVPWIWPAIGANVTVTILMSINTYRQKIDRVLPLCVVLFIAVWVEKGMGMIVPGFTPSPLGEVVEYHPTWVEVTVTAGVWALGIAVTTVLVKVAISIELGQLTHKNRVAFAHQPFYVPRTAAARPANYEPRAAPASLGKFHEPHESPAQRPEYEPRGGPRGPREKL
jgi:molybdopterin-containing oxidoreductase family membrane subunit